MSYRWAVVVMLWFVCVFNYADRQAIFSVYAPLNKEMGIDKIQFGVIGGAFMWVYAVAMPFTGLIVDRVSRKALILGGLTFWSAVTAATALAESFEQLVLCRALEGLGEAFYFPASMSLISDYHSPKTRSRAMAIHQSSVYVGTVLGGTVAGYCGEHYGWRTGFWLFGGAGIVLAAILVVTLREPARGAEDDRTTPATPTHPLAGAGTVLSTPMVRLLLGVFIGTVFVGSVFLAWMPVYLSEEFGLTLSKSGLNATVWLQVGSVIGVIAGGILADRLVSRGVRGRLLVPAAGLLVGAPLLLVAGQARTVELLLVLLFAFGVCKGLYDSNTWAALYDEVRPEHRGVAQGLVNGLGWLLGGAWAPIAYAAAAARYGAGNTVSATSVIYLVTGLMLAVGVALARRK